MFSARSDREKESSPLAEDPGQSGYSVLVRGPGGSLVCSVPIIAIIFGESGEKKRTKDTTPSDRTAEDVLGEEVLGGAAEGQRGDIGDMR